MRRFPKIKVTILAFLILIATIPLAAQTDRVATLAVRDRRLPNGLRVLSVEDRTSPTVAIQVWYHVGSKDDPEGRSGFAHLFEHMMFKGTRNMADEMMDRLTEDIGGENNAFTHDDVTVYHETVPSNYLQTLLWAEADRMRWLNVNANVFASERDVVKEEFRQNYLAQPYGRLNLLVSERSYTLHPYRRSGIGNIAELEASTLEDVRRFYETYYRPDNATLVVVGDFDARQLDAWVDRYFAVIPRPAGDLPRVAAREPARTAERRYVEYAPNVPLPAVALTFLIPPAAEEDVYALQVAETILSAGESSRLYRALVYEQQIAQSATADADLREHTGLFNFTAIMATGKRAQEGEASMLREIARMQNQPVSQTELTRALNQLVTSQIRERETNSGRGFAIGWAAVVLGDVTRVNRDLERLQRVTAADVQRVMRQYFTPTNRVVIHYLSEESRPAGSTNATGSRR
jgi:zinc protease